jgi:hypothetical protein
MLVVQSRLDILKYKKEFDDQIPRIAAGTRVEVRGSELLPFFCPV